MGVLAVVERDLVKRAPALGLGWLIVLAIAGAVLLFTAVGLLLTWKVKVNTTHEAEEENITTVYQINDSTDDPRHFLPKKLSKRKLLSESTSRLSLSLPPVLPPLPTYHSFGFLGQGSKKPARSWVDEDRLHGPKVNKSARESWFSRDSWLGRVPTLPSLLMLEDIEKAEVDDGPEQSITVQKRQSLTILSQSQTAPELSEQDEPPRGRGRIAAESHGRPPARPSITDSSLHQILRSTEERLRDGNSRSPTKTPRSSPLKASPVKTPHSHRSISSARTSGSARISRSTPSPSKRSTVQAQTPNTHSRDVSASSVGSAANSLIAEAIQELELPGGLSSPSRLRGKEWEQGENNLPEQNRPRSKSLDSQASSSLSTLYSVGEPEERNNAADLERALNEQDPFVEQEGSRSSSAGSNAPLFGPRGMKRRTKTMSAMSFSGNSTTSKAYSPLRQPSYSVQAVGGGGLPLSIVLQPPSEPRFSEDLTKHSSAERIGLAFPVSPSATSLVTPSVTTIADDDQDDSFLGDSTTRDTPKAEWIPPAHMDSLKKDSPASTAASSPYDERAMLSLLLSSSAPRRALPEPPLYVSHVDNSALPTPLSPRPQRDFSHQLKQMSNASSSSSNYDGPSSPDPAAVSTGSPTRRPKHRSLREPPPQGSVGSAIMDLRRMNSMLSSYSLASVNSETDSPSLPALRGGGFGPGPKPASVGRKNYLNLGTSPNSRRNSRKPSVNGNKRIGLGIEIREDVIDEGKENHSPGQKTPQRDTPQGLREGRRSSGNQVRDSIAAGKPRLGPIADLMAEHKRDEKRQSVQSLGLYDKDGFLKSSPERDAKGRCLRM